MAGEVYVGREHAPRSILYERLLDDGRASAVYLFTEQHGSFEREVDGEWADCERGPRLVAINVVSAETQTLGLDVTKVRDTVATGDLMREVRECLAVADERTREIGSFLHARRKGGRPTTRRPIDHALMAWAYVYACKRSSRPFVWLASELREDAGVLKGRRTEAIRTRPGFLTKAGTSGRPGGSMTATTKRILRERGFDPTNGDPIAAIATFLETDDEFTGAGADTDGTKEVHSPEQAAFIDRFTKLVASIAPHHRLRAKAHRLEPYHPTGPNFASVGVEASGTKLHVEIRLPKGHYEAVGRSLNTPDRWFRYDAVGNRYSFSLNVTEWDRRERSIETLLRDAYRYGSLGEGIYLLPQFDVWPWNEKPTTATRLRRRPDPTVES
jgi:hypothetical protein